MKTTIHGFSLRRSKDGYTRAFRRIGEKVHIVYVGKDPAKAQEKIERYCKKHGIAQPDSELVDLLARVAKNEQRLAAIEANLPQ